jgi:rhodanese-related sulfurtransferase
MPTVDDLLTAARGRLPGRVTVTELPDALARGALVVDIRPVEQRVADGDLTGAIVVDRNVLEWRLDPACEHRLAQITGYDLEVVLVCNEGYQSSLAAATLQDLGLRRATDLDGGFQALLAASSPLVRRAAV